MVNISGIINVLMVLLAVSAVLAVVQFGLYFRSVRPKRKAQQVETRQELKKAEALRTTAS